MSPMRDFWIYTIAILSLMYVIPLVSQACGDKKVGNIIFGLGYGFIVYLIIGSMIQVNDSDVKARKLVTTNSQITKNTTNVLLLVMTLSVLYCKYVR